MGFEKTWVFLGAGCLALLGACGPQPARARLEGRSGSDMRGDATFTPRDGRVEARVTVENLPPGRHGIHIHEWGDCSSHDSTSSGGHWNPTNQPHGSPDVPTHHVGDMGNLEVGADGRGTLVLSSTEWSVGGADTSNVVGHALVVHADADDLVSQPAGNSGARIGCGVITLE